MKTRTTLTSLAAALVAGPGLGLETDVAGAAERQDATLLAKKTQDPTADIISFPLQNNFNFGLGPKNEMQYVLNVQPVIPVPLNRAWKLLTRTIVPVIQAPAPGPGQDSAFGLGDSTLSTWLSPRLGEKVTYGFGLTWQVPTATNTLLGSGEWGVGPSGVLVYKRAAWVVGALASHVWDIDGGCDQVSFTTLQPFINYNLAEGLALDVTSITTANWESPAGDRWIVPVGGGISKVVHLDKLPMKVGAAAFYNVETPKGGPEWQLQIQITFILPE